MRTALLIPAIASAIVAHSVLAATLPGTDWQGRVTAPVVLVGADQMTTANMNKAAKCKISNYSFGTNQFEVPINMTTSADGWFWVAPRRNAGGGYPGEISEQPEHGQTVVIQDDDARNRFAYKPQAGYVGPDHFKVQLYASSRVHPVLIITIDVQ